MVWYGPLTVFISVQSQLIPSLLGPWYNYTPGTARGFLCVPSKVGPSLKWCVCMCMCLLVGSRSMHAVLGIGWYITHRAEACTHYSRLINHRDALMTPRCSSNVFWQGWAAAGAELTQAHIWPPRVSDRTPFARGARMLDAISHAQPPPARSWMAWRKKGYGIESEGERKRDKYVGIKWGKGKGKVWSK